MGWSQGEARRDREVPLSETDSDGVSWNPLVPGVGDDQHAAHDELRERCPVAHSDVLGWSLFRHADIVQVLEDDESFSAVVSSHLSVPNGMDPPEHERYRRAIEPYFNEESMSAFHPKCTALARDLVAGLPMEMEFDFCERFGRPYAARVQCAFMGWPEESGLVLSDWLRRSQSATASRSKEKQKLLAVEFERHVLDLLERRRRSGSVGDDVTGRLLGQQKGGLTFSYDELVSVLRNWTAGELGTIAASVGILVHTLAENPLLQEQLREDRLRLADGVLEILRAHGPLVSNRRIVKRACRIGEKNLGQAFADLVFGEPGRPCVPCSARVQTGAFSKGEPPLRSRQARVPGETTSPDGVDVFLGCAFRQKLLVSPRERGGSPPSKVPGEWLFNSPSGLGVRLMRVIQARVRTLFGSCPGFTQVGALVLARTNPRRAIFRIAGTGS